MIPQINGTVTHRQGSICLPAQISVYNPNFEAWCLIAFGERTGLTQVSCEKAYLTITRDPSLPHEGYRMDIGEHGIMICAAAEQGVIWALTTLAHLHRAGEIPCCIITDAPRFRHRGLQLDCVRHFFPAEEVERVIEELSLVKMNVLHWHLANDQGFRIECHTFPKLHSQCADAYYTQAEIRRIVAYAKVRGVEVIPEISMPGHTSAILAAYPALSCRGEAVTLPLSGGIYPVTICPGKEETYDFLKQLLDEVCPLFPGKWFHVGGDEAPDWEWALCPHCRTAMARHRLHDTRQLQGYFAARVAEILRMHGKSIICFNDSLTASNFTWRADGEQQTIVQYWNISYADATERYLEAGGRMLYSDMFELYFDYPSAMSSMKKVYHCTPAIRTREYPDAEGMEACLWTENVATTEVLEQRLFPRLYALAENAWCTEKDYSSFVQRVESLIAAARSRGIACQSIAQADPQGEDKKHGIMEYTAIMQNSMSPEMRELAVKFTKPNEEFQSRFMQQFFGIG